MTISYAQLIPNWDKSSAPDFVKNPNPYVYLEDNYVTVDFEVTNKDKGSALNRENGILLTVCRLGPNHPQAKQGRDRVFVGTEYEQQGLLELIGEAKFIVAHNAKFELQWLKRIGLNLKRVLPYCTQIGEYVYGGNRRWRLGLDQVAQRYEVGHKASLVSGLIKGGVCPSEIPLPLLLDYCKDDVNLTEAVFLKQRQILADNGLLAVAYCRNLLTPVLADMEFEGLQLDEQRVFKEFEAVSEEFNRTKQALDACTGGINQNSPKQVREFLYGKLGFQPPTDYKGKPLLTAKGEYATGKEVIVQLRPSTPEQERFLEVYKRLNPLKRRIQLLTQLKKCCEEDNGHLYAAFNQTITQTHRLSSSGRKYGVQFQNFPRQLKSLFRARNAGSLLVEGDSPQLEFRVAVELGNDRTGYRAVCTGVDVHKLTSDVMGLGRTAAKPYTFKPLYGGTSGTPKERRYYDAFRREYSGVYNTQQGWVYEVLANKALRIASGLIFYWPDTKVTRSGYVENTASIFNYPVQSFATADIVPLCLIAVWHRLGSYDGEGIRLVNTVHDSIVAEVPENMLQYYKGVLEQAFTKDIYLLIERLYDRKLKIPLGVGIKAAEHWGEGEEEKLEALDKIEAYLSSDLGDDVRTTGIGSKSVLAEPQERQVHRSTLPRPELVSGSNIRGE